MIPAYSAKHTRIVKSLKNASELKFVFFDSWGASPRSCRGHNHRAAERGRAEHPGVGKPTRTPGIAVPAARHGITVLSHHTSAAQLVCTA